MSVPPPHSDPLDPTSLQLSALEAEVVRLRAAARWRGRALAAVGAGLLALGMGAGAGLVDVGERLASCRANLMQSRQAHIALASAPDDAAVAPSPL